MSSSTYLRDIFVWTTPFKWFLLTYSQKEPFAQKHFTMNISRYCLTGQKDDEPYYDSDDFLEIWPKFSLMIPIRLIIIKNGLEAFPIFRIQSILLIHLAKKSESRLLQSKI